MIQAGVTQHPVEGADSAGFGIIAAVDHPTDPRVHDRASAHDAGLEGDIEGAVAEPPVTDMLGCLAEGYDFCVGRWISRRLAEIESPSDDAAFVDHHCTDRHLTTGAGHSGQSQ